MDTSAINNKTNYITNSNITFAFWCRVLQYHEDVEEVKTLILRLQAQKRLEEFLHSRTALDESPLMLTARRGKIEAVAALMGAYEYFNTPRTNVHSAINYVDRFGRTALMWAACSGQTEIADLLLSRMNPLERDRAICIASNSKGETALSLAQRAKHPETANFLISCLSNPALAVQSNILTPNPSVVFSSTELTTRQQVQPVEAKRKRAPSKIVSQTEKTEKPPTDNQPKRKKRT